MEKSYCEVLLKHYPKVAEFEDLRSTYIASCVFNNFLCYTAIMLNIVTIHAIRKTSSLSKPLKTLLLSLAVSDVGVGLFVQPFYTTLLVKWLHQINLGCNIYAIFTIVANMFSIASFLGVVAVSVDRCLAIHLHLRYQELVTHKHVVAVVISIWVLSAFLPLMVFWVPFEISSHIELVLGVVSLVLTTVVYIKIYSTVRRHNTQIRALQIQQVTQNGEMANFASLVKTAVGTFYVYFVFLACYLPYFIILVVVESNGPSIALNRFAIFSVILIFLNSSLNPVIYCWKMRQIRHAVVNILRNMSWIRNRASH
ncbi:adenosine receptor A2b-like [Oculina patagonica]